MLAQAYAELIGPLLLSLEVEFGTPGGVVVNRDRYWLGPLLVNACPRLRAGDTPAGIASCAPRHVDIDAEVEEGGSMTWPRQDHAGRLKRCEAVLAVERLAELTKSVACYRMVFAQPRQDDLLAHFPRLHSAQALAEWAGELPIDLLAPFIADDRTR